MAISTSTTMTLAEYLEYDDSTDTRYEFVNGELVLMPPESDLNDRIATLLIAYFLQRGIPFYQIRTGTEIVVTGSRATARLPDLLVLGEELAVTLEGAPRSTVTADMPPPQLAVEVVSPGSENRDRDYRYKRSEYAARGIPEYWIVDPQQQKVTILEWVSGLYEERVFVGEEALISPTFGKLDLVAEKLLSAQT